MISGTRTVKVPYMILPAIFNLPNGEMFAAFCIFLNNFLGPLTTPIISEIILKAILGINLISHRFHERQALLGKPLSMEQMIDGTPGLQE